MKTKQFVDILKACDTVITKHQDALMEAKEVRINAFNGLAKVCGNRDPDKKHCRHEALKREADAKGVTAFQNGCHRQICPLLK